MQPHPLWPDQSDGDSGECKTHKTIDWKWSSLGTHLLPGPPPPKEPNGIPIGAYLAHNLHWKLLDLGIQPGAQLVQIGSNDVTYRDYHLIEEYLDRFLRDEHGPPTRNLTFCNLPFANMAPAREPPRFEEERAMIPQAREEPPEEPEPFIHRRDPNVDPSMSYTIEWVIDRHIIKDITVEKKKDVRIPKRKKKSRSPKNGDEFSDQDQDKWYDYS